MEKAGVDDSIVYGYRKVALSVSSEWRKQRSVFDILCHCQSLSHVRRMPHTIVRFGSLNAAAWHAEDSALEDVT